MNRQASSFRVVSALCLCGALLVSAAATAYAQATQQFAVKLSNFVIDGAPPQVRAGVPLAFVASSSGFPHNLAIDGNGVDLKPSTPNLTEGQTGTITFAALQPGTYHLYCPVGSATNPTLHRQNGMDVTFTVVAGAVALPRTGGAALALPLGLAAAGLVSGAAGIALRRRKG